jgi:hypothetical protein
MPFDPRFAIDVIYPAATSAYLVITVPAPPLPAGYTLVGAIQADPRQAVAAKHVGQEVLVHGGFKPLDVRYAHHLTTYLAGLQKLLP